MKTDIIARYVTNRINENAKWYTDKAVLATDFSISLAEVECYHLLQSVLLHELARGHTVLVIHDRLGADLLPLPTTVLPAWQQRCLVAIIEVISGTEEGDGELLSKSIVTLNELAQSHDTTALKNFIQAQLNTYDQRWTYQGIAPRQRDVLTALALTVFRICHLFVTKIKSLDVWIEFLAKGVFFADIIQLQATTRHQLPICYLKNNDTVYLWTNRAYHAETALLAHIKRISSAKVTPFTWDSLSESLNPKQISAVNLVSKQAFVLITGGPGTGKTFTVAQIVIALSQLPNADGLRLGLAAPTGKAAQRMSESLLASLPDNLSIQMPEPKTIHRLLGIGSSGTPKYHAQNPLAYDVLIIDEASMLGTELASQLFAAVATGCRVILLGDAHQLAAVDAGAVLADLCRIEALQRLRVNLSESRRFRDDSGVGQLAKLINAVDTDISFSQVMALIDAHSQLSFIDVDQQPIGQIYEQLSTLYQNYFAITKNLRFKFEHYSDDHAQNTINELFNALNQYRILCASHLGALGDEAINAYLTQYHQRYQKIPPSRSPWYHGRVVMVTKNLYELGLFNGDVGICLWAASGLVVYFEGKKHAISVDMLSDVVVSTAYAITVHKSQGSEWQAVSLVFDDYHMRLLSKELIYTAVTRAKSQVCVYGSQMALMHAINTPTMRQTGLALIASLEDVS